MALKITVREVKGVTVVSPEGRIGVGEEANALRDRVKSLLADGKTRLVLNLHKMTLMDSAGLGTLVGLHHSAATCGARLCLTNLSAMLKEALQITRLLAIFEISASEEDAVRALSEKP